MYSGLHFYYLLPTTYYLLPPALCITHYLLLSTYYIITPMEGMGRAIVSGLFVVLVMMSIVVLGLSFLSPLEGKKNTPKYSGTQVGNQVESSTPSFNPLSIFGFGNKEPEQNNPAPAAPASPSPGSNTPTTPTEPSLSLTAIGTSPVVSGRVVQLNSAPVVLSAEPGSSQAPYVSRPIVPTEFPYGSHVIKISEQGANPTNFSVRAGAVVNLVVMSQGEMSHVFRFKGNELKAIALGVGPDEARAITFNAPSAGTYEFFCDVPGHKTRETGTMTVN